MIHLTLSFDSRERLPRVFSAALGLSLSRVRAHIAQFASQSALSDGYCLIYIKVVSLQVNADILHFVYFRLEQAAAIFSTLTWGECRPRFPNYGVEPLLVLLTFASLFHESIHGRIYCIKVPLESIKRLRSAVQFCSVMTMSSELLTGFVVYTHHTLLESWVSSTKG